MTKFQSIVNDIKALKIQGAENVAKASAKALFLVAYAYKEEKKENILRALERSRIILIQTRPTEPGMRNVLNYLLFNLKNESDVYKVISERVGKISKHFENSNNQIIKIGEKKIMNNSIIFTHCHSSTVVNILKEAKRKGKKFQVYNTETRPLLQGRITARELSKAGIPVVHFIDSAARLALKKADLMLIGADAITSEGKVINKVGSEMFAEMAEKQNTPVYVCTNSWKFDPLTVFGFEEEIETRSGKEVWLNKPKGVQINNLAFEKINPELIAGIISELGVYKPEVFVEEVRRNYPWII